MTQASLAYIRARMGECRQALQASLESAIEQDLVSADDSAMKHYLLAITSLDESQQAAATAATRLAVAEKALVAFKTAVKLHERSASSPPASVSGMYRMISILDTTTYGIYIFNESGLWG